jgi:hypothetical protein
MCATVGARNVTCEDDQYGVCPPAAVRDLRTHPLVGHDEVDIFDRAADAATYDEPVRTRGSMLQDGSHLPPLPLMREAIPSECRGRPRRGDGLLRGRRPDGAPRRGERIAAGDG